MDEWIVRYVPRNDKCSIGDKDFRCIEATEIVKAYNMLGAINEILEVEDVEKILMARKYN